MSDHKASQNLELEIASKVAHSLSANRSKQEHTWRELGECLYQISPSMLEVWIAITNKTKVFTEAECKECWDNDFRFNPTCLTEPMGCLETWARIDDPQGFKSLIRTYTINDIVKNGSFEVNTDYVAMLIHKLFRYQYRYTSSQKWYEFRCKHHRWFLVDNEEALKQTFIYTAVNEYLYALIYCNTKATQAMLFCDKEEHMKAAHRIYLLADQLKNVANHQIVMDKCKKLFSDSRFEYQLNKNPNLNAYEKGIFDHEIGGFRDGRPSDYISQEYLL